MLDQLVRHWWVLALRGVLAILFGVIAFAWPSITLLVFVTLFGVYALVDGIFALAAAVRSSSSQRWALLLEGVCGIAVGILAFARPVATAVALLYLIAAWAIITGIMEIIAAIHLRKQIENEWMLGLSGALSVLLGILLVIMPGAGLLAWVWVVGSYAIFFGILLLLLAFRLHRMTPKPLEQARA